MPLIMADAKKNNWVLQRIYRSHILGAGSFTFAGAICGIWGGLGPVSRLFSPLPD